MGCFNSKKVEGGDAYKKETAPAPTPAPAPKPAPVSQPPVASSESKLTPVAESPSTAGKPPTTESSKEEKKPSKEEAPDKPTGQDKEAQPEKEPEVTAPTSQASQPEDDHAKYASKYSVWDKAFKDEAGEKMKLGQKEVRKLFKKVLPGMSQTVFDLLYETVKKDDNGSINFIDFSRIGEAFVKKDSSGFPTVDPEKFRKIIDDDKALREKTRGSITEGAKSGELATILKSLDIKPEGSNKEDEYKRLVKVYPNWKTLFDAADADQKGGLGLDQLKKVLRSLGSFSNKQMKILYYSMDEDGNGTIDYCEFCWMAEALLEGKVNSEQFGGVDPENFRQAMSEAKELRGKVRSNLIAGLKSGQLKSLVATVPGDDKEKKKPKAVELTPVGEELREKYPVWWEHFCNADSDKTGELSLKSLRNLCRKEIEKLSQKQLRALLDTIEDDKPTTGWADTASILEALSGDLTRFPSIDPEKWKQIIVDEEALKEKFKKNLTEGKRSGALEACLLDMPQPHADEDKDVVGKEFENKYPDWRKTYLSVCVEGETTLGVNEMSTAMRKIVKKMSRSQVEMLFDAMDEDANGRVDWCEFCWMGEAFMENNLERFPQIDSEKFKALFEASATTRKKLATNLKEGLKTGELKALAESYGADAPAEAAAESTDAPAEASAEAAEAPAEDAPAEDADAPAEAKDTPAEDAPAKDTPAEDAPASEAIPEPEE